MMTNEPNLEARVKSATVSSVKTTINNWQRDDSVPRGNPVTEPMEPLFGTRATPGFSGETTVQLIPAHLNRTKARRGEERKAGAPRTKELPREPRNSQENPVLQDTRRPDSDVISLLHAINIKSSIKAAHFINQPAAIPLVSD